LPTDPVQWQELAVLTQKPEEIASIEITRGDQPPLALQREKEQWKLAKGDGTVSQTNVQSLVNTLASLGAVRWAGATIPEHGFEKPSLVATFKTNGEAGGKLTVGSATAEELWHATLEGKPGTFLIARPDFEALQLPLIEKPPGSTPAASEEAPGAPGAPAAAAPEPAAPPAAQPDAPAPGAEAPAAP
jgi:hypothetical protein